MVLTVTTTFPRTTGAEGGYTMSSALPVTPSDPALRT
jgi:hypothetical protein